MASLLGLAGVLTIACASPADTARPNDAPKDASTAKSLELLWTLQGDWGGVDAPAGSGVAYGTRAGELCSIDLASREVVALQKDVRPCLRTGVVGEHPFIVSFGPWDNAVAAYDYSGQLLWTYDTPEGVNDAWPADLDGDGDSEVVIGLNAGGGVAALDSKGSLLWSDQTVANVWAVTVVSYPEATHVFTTSATGHVYAFSSSGEKLAKLQAPCYATTVRIADQPLVGGTHGQTTVVATLDHSGWSTIVSQSRGDIDSLVTARAAPWVAAVTRSGTINVLNASNGRILGTIADGHPPPQLAWAGDRQTPTLLAANERGLHAYRLRGPALAEGLVEQDVAADEAIPAQ